MMRNLAVATLVTAATLAAGGAGAAPWRIVSDAPDSVWVLDAASGALVWCRLEAPAGPKVLDVFGDMAEPRPATPRRVQPECAAIRAGAAADPRAERAGALFALGADGVGDALLAPRDDGDQDPAASGGEAGVRPRYLDITVN